MQNYCYHCMRPLSSSSICGYCGFNNQDDPSLPPYHLKPGTVLANRYLIGNVLGEGGFGITYIGLDQTLSKRVAVKEFYPSGAANRTCYISDDVIVTQGKAEFFQNGVDRFLFEAKNVAAFSAEDGIVDVLDYFQANNTAYIVMEYLEGETLKDCVNRHGRFKSGELVELMYPVMKSLKTIHANGVIHRDISPDNIMYTKNGKLKLMDFGSARYYTNEEREMSVVLKQGFAPEEQYRRNGRQGPFTDVYALCATMYTCITGIVPDSSLDRQKYDTLVPPSQLGVAISPVHERALMHGLAVDPQNRCRNMDTLISEFQATIDINATVSAEQTYTPPQQTPQTPVQHVPQAPPGWNNSGYVRSQQAPQQRSNTPVIVAIILTLAAILTVGGVIAFIYFSNKDNNNDEQSATTSPTQAVYATLPDEAETTVPPTTVPETTQPTTAPKPTERVTAPAPTKSADSHTNYTESEIIDIVKSHTDGILSSLDARTEYQTINGYDVVFTDDDYIWISTPHGQMKDSMDDKTWYMYDRNGNLYFIYKHANNQEYRYHIHNDEVVYYLVGSEEKGNQVKHYQGDSAINSSVQAMVTEAYNALRAVSE